MTRTARAVATGSGPRVELAGADPVTGASVVLAQFGGKPVVLNVWASWCAGCNEEAADLAEFARAYPEAQVIGLVFCPYSRPIVSDWAPESPAGGAASDRVVTVHAPRG